MRFAQKFLPMLALALWLPAMGQSYKKLEPGNSPPDRLSDLQKYLMIHVRRTLAENISFGPVRLKGRSSDIMAQGNFYELEMSLKPFEFQGLNVEKMEILVKQMRVDAEGLKKWELKVLDYKEAQTRLIFSLRSLEKKLAQEQPELRLSADSAERVVEIKGRGRFFFVPAHYETRAAFRWDEKAKKLYLVPKSVSWADFNVPRWLWWLGSGECPSKALLDLSASWIPLNFQEIYVGWDRVNLSTNW